MHRKRMPASLILSILTFAAFTADPAARGDQAASPGAARKPTEEISHAAPWKSAAPGAAGPSQGLEKFGWRVGTWLSEEWQGEGARRHRLKLAYAWDLKKKALVETSSKVYEDGREEPYLKAILFPHGGREVVAAYLFFDDGLFADAAWIHDGAGVQRLDCDLVWPDGRTGRVRDIFVREGDDRIRWAMYQYRNGKAADEPAFGTVLRRVTES